MSSYGSGTADVLVRCDVGPGMGVGHLMRCVALAEELLARGLTVVFCADAASVPFAREQLDRRGIPSIAPVDSPQDHVALVRRLRPRLVVIDSYVLPPSVYAAVRAEPPTLLALVDGPPDGRDADVYLDQNIGAEDDVHLLPEGARRLAGLRYALMRDDIRRQRPREVRDGGPDVPRVLAVFGGTDAFGAAPVVAERLVETGRPFELTAVAARPETAAELRRVASTASTGQSVEVIGTTPHLADRVTASDLVISAAGTSAWELVCLGAACALVCVADNQAQSYVRAVDSGLTAGLGYGPELRQPQPAARHLLQHLLGSGEARLQLRRAAWQAVDGRGRERVVDELLAPAGTGSTAQRR